MSLRKRIFITVSVALGIIIAALILFFVFRKKTSPPDKAPAVEQSSEDSAAGAAPAALPSGVLAVPPEDLGERYVRQLAGIFVERFGSYSNQDGNKHLEDAVAMATERMAAWLRTQAIAAGQEYRGKTTRVVASKVEAYSDSAAKVHVDVQEETTPAGAAAEAYRSGRVELAKVEGEWKVSGLFWDK